MQTINNYQLSIPRDKLSMIDTRFLLRMCKLKYAIDIVAPENTPVLAAAADGISYLC
jgi:hypothetical protein